MTLARVRLALRPVLRAPAPTLTRGIRNYDVNTPVEPLADKLQGSEAPDIHNEANAQGSKLESAEDRAFAEAIDKGTTKNNGQINEKDIDLELERNADKVSSFATTYSH